MSESHPGRLPQASSPVSRDTALLHGHSVTYRQAGTSGPTVVLIHGIAGSSETWDPVLPLLADHCRVIAPDLLGHGASAKPRGDYSLGAYASGIRDLLGLLGYGPATILGHSLGGGIAMQFAYLFPDRCERLVLSASGGLGDDVTPILRAATLPGMELLLPLLAHSRVRSVVGGIASFLTRQPSPLVIRPAAREVARSWGSFSDGEAAAAFVHTLRSVVDLRGQRVSAHDRLYLTSAIPTLVVWGVHDMFIPVSHAHTAHAAMPGSRLELFEAAGHFPHLDEPLRFALLLRDFINTTEPAHRTPAAAPGPPAP